MKMPLLITLFLAISLSSISQVADTDRIARLLPDEQILAPLRYLSSDRLRGRHIGLSEIDTSADYIARAFRSAGAKPLPGDSGYFQPFHHPFTPREIFHMDRQVASNISISFRRSLKNILAFVPGTDARLRSQYVILSAHYDHAGVSDSTVMEDGKLDSIFNGARDNATGIAAVIAAARYFARYPPKRSVLFICYTAEEEGAIGSKYYVQHPVVPLDQTVFNLNVDNAGYNTTHAVCLFGLGRTTVDALVLKACMQYGLSVLPEPQGQDLFERSDNYPLAQIGIPAPCYSLGMTDWDKEISDHYHRVSDEVGNMDLGYVVKFIRAYILSAQYIADEALQPRWVNDDPNEANWRLLYRKEQ